VNLRKNLDEMHIILKIFAICKSFYSFIQNHESSHNFNTEANVDILLYSNFEHLDWTTSGLLDRLSEEVDWKYLNELFLWRLNQESAW
jgi:hypothetical protein